MKSSPIAFQGMEESKKYLRESIVNHTEYPNHTPKGQVEHVSVIQNGGASKSCPLRCTDPIQGMGGHGSTTCKKKKKIKKFLLS